MKRRGSPQGIRWSKIPGAKPLLQKHESLPTFHWIPSTPAPAETSPLYCKAFPTHALAAGRGEPYPKDRILHGPRSSLAPSHPKAGRAPRSGATPEQARQPVTPVCLPQSGPTPAYPKAGRAPRQLRSWLSTRAPRSGPGSRTRGRQGVPRPWPFPGREARAQASAGPPAPGAGPERRAQHSRQDGDGGPHHAVGETAALGVQPGPAAIELLHLGLRFRHHRGPPPCPPRSRHFLETAPASGHGR